MTIYEQMVSSVLDDYSSRIKSGNCKMTDEGMEKLMQTMILYDNTLKLSKDQACSELHLSRSSFDDKVRCGLIPRGLKVRGFKELMWDKASIELAKENICLQNIGENLL